MATPSITGAGVGVLVIKDGTFLLGLRASDPAKADSALHGEGTWTMPGGKVHLGESFEQAASRELKEETGLIGKNLQVFSLSNENDLIPGVHFITVGLFCDDFAGEPNTMEPDEITEWRWFPLSAPPTNMFPPSRQMLENYLAKKFYQP